MSSPCPSFSDVMRPLDSSVLLTSQLSYQHTTLSLPRSKVVTYLSNDALRMSSDAKVATCSLIVTNSAQNMKQFSLHMTHSDDLLSETIFPLTHAMLLHPSPVAGVRNSTSNAADTANARSGGMISLQSYQEELLLCFNDTSPSTNERKRIVEEWSTALCDAITCLLLTDACITRVYRNPVGDTHLSLDNVEYAIGKALAFLVTESNPSVAYALRLAECKWKLQLTGSQCTMDSRVDSALRGLKELLAKAVTFPELENDRDVRRLKRVCDRMENATREQGEQYQQDLIHSSREAKAEMIAEVTTPLSPVAYCRRVDWQALDPSVAMEHQQEQHGCVEEKKQDLSQGFSLSPHPLFCAQHKDSGHSKIPFPYTVPHKTRMVADASLSLLHHFSPSQSQMASQEKNMPPEGQSEPLQEEPQRYIYHYHGANCSALVRSLSGAEDDEEFEVKEDDTRQLSAGTAAASKLAVNPADKEDIDRKNKSPSPSIHLSEDDKQEEKVLGGELNLSCSYDIDDEDDYNDANYNDNEHNNELEEVKVEAISSPFVPTKSIVPVLAKAVEGQEQHLLSQELNEHGGNGSGDGEVEENENDDSSIHYETVGVVAPLVYSDSDRETDSDTDIDGDRGNSLVTALFSDDRDNPMFESVSASFTASSSTSSRIIPSITQDSNDPSTPESSHSTSDTALCRDLRPNPEFTQTDSESPHVLITHPRPQPRMSSPETTKLTVAPTSSTTTPATPTTTTSTLATLSTSSVADNDLDVDTGAALTAEQRLLKREIENSILGTPESTKQMQLTAKGAPSPSLTAAQNKRLREIMNNINKSSSSCNSGGSNSAKKTDRRGKANHSIQAVRCLETDQPNTTHPPSTITHRFQATTSSGSSNGDSLNANSVKHTSTSSKNITRTQPSTMNHTPVISKPKKKIINRVRKTITTRVPARDTWGIPCLHIKERSGQTIEINAEKPTPIETEYFKGHILMMLNTDGKLSRYNRYKEHFTGRQRKFELQLQGQMKTLPEGEIMLGGELPQPMVLSFFTKTLLSVLTKFATTINPSAHFSFGTKPVPNSLDHELPHLMFPLMKVMDRVIITPPGEELPSLGKEIPESKEEQKIRKANTEKFKFQLGYTYTFSLYSMYVDFTTWDVCGVPGFGPKSLGDFIGKQHPHMVCYEIAEKDLNQGNGVVMHKQVHKKYLLHMEMKHENNLSAAEVMEANNDIEVEEEVEEEKEEEEEEEKEEEEEEEEVNQIVPLTSSTCGKSDHPSSSSAAATTATSTTATTIATAPSPQQLQLAELLRMGQQQNEKYLRSSSTKQLPGAGEGRVKKSHFKGEKKATTDRTTTDRESDQNKCAATDEKTDFVMETETLTETETETETNDELAVKTRRSGIASRRFKWALRLCVVATLIVFLSLSTAVLPSRTLIHGRDGDDIGTEYTRDSPSMITSVLDDDLKPPHSYFRFRWRGLEVDPFTHLPWHVQRLSEQQWGAVRAQQRGVHIVLREEVKGVFLRLSAVLSSSGGVLSRAVGEAITHLKLIGTKLSADILFRAEDVLSSSLSLEGVDESESEGIFGAEMPINVAVSTDPLLMERAKRNNNNDNNDDDGGGATSMNFDTSRYKGDSKDGNRHGHGIYTWPGGRQYTGDWVDNEMHGFGDYVWEGNYRYSGSWLHNHRSGVGLQVFADGMQYEGGYLLDQRSGYGEYSWPNGEIYKGEWREDEMHGEGVFTYADGSVYRGRYEDGVQLGSATATTATDTTSAVTAVTAVTATTSSNGADSGMTSDPSVGVVASSSDGKSDSGGLSVQVHDFLARFLGSGGVDGSSSSLSTVVADITESTLRKSGEVVGQLLHGTGAPLRGQKQTQQQKQEEETKQQEKKQSGNKGSIEL